MPAYGSRRHIACRGPELPSAPTLRPPERFPVPAIYRHPGPPGGNLGLQISGMAERLTEEPSADGWQSFRIVPREIWCFDSRVFGRERRQVARPDLRLREPI
jgi:hypothetical protein